MQNTKIRVFTDFDGTITIKDLGDEIFKTYGQFEPYNSQLKNREIDIKDYWKILCSTFPDDFTESTISDYALTAEIDPYFKNFAEYCKSNNIPLHVVSDGFDSYITPILKRENLDYLPLASNKLIFNSENYDSDALCKLDRTPLSPFLQRGEIRHFLTPSSQEGAGGVLSQGTPLLRGAGDVSFQDFNSSHNSNITPIYPGASESCRCFCASCKRNFVLSNTDEDEIIIFIGDGYSDYCAAEHSDIIFAKKHLAAYCNANKIPHYPFSTFFDVKRLLNDAISKGKLKKRNQAEVKRKNAFEAE